MEHPALQNRLFLLFYILLWAGVSVAMAISIWPITGNISGHALLWGLAAGLSFGGISLPLWSILRYADYASFKPIHAVVSYIALASLTILTWLGATYILVYLLSPGNEVMWFVDLIPLQALIGALLFSIVILFYNKWLGDLQRQEEERQLEALEKTAGKEISPETKEILERIAIKVGQKIEVVLVEDIAFIEAEGDYTMIYTPREHFLKEQTMKYFEEHLPPGQFIRVHRSYIVNIHSVSKIELFEKQTHLITLKNGFQIKASAAGYKLLKSTLKL